MYRDTANVEHDVYGYTGNNWRDGNGNGRFEGNLYAVPGKPFIASQQKTAVLGTAHIIRKVLRCET